MITTFANCHLGNDEYTTWLVCVLQYSSDVWINWIGVGYSMAAMVYYTFHHYNAILNSNTCTVSSSSYCRKGLKYFYYRSIFCVGCYKHWTFLVFFFLVRLTFVWCPFIFVRHLHSSFAWSLLGTVYLIHLFNVIIVIFLAKFFRQTNRRKSSVSEKQQNDKP